MVDEEARAEGAEYRQKEVDEGGEWAFVIPFGVDADDAIDGERDEGGGEPEDPGLVGAEIEIGDESAGGDEGQQDGAGYRRGI